MSNTLAIAATTAAIRNLLWTQIPIIDKGLNDLEVTTQPLDLARKDIGKTQLNLFLYHTAVNAAWRNHDMPGQIRPGETGVPPLALNLHYLITAYGRGDSDNDALSHRVLGSAMSMLHDHPLLGGAEIASALLDTDPGTQIERVRITPLPMGIDEISKLWTVFQTQYRVSAAYEVGVILIDSRRAARAPLPVLNRGAEDRGAVATTGSAPTLDSIRLPRLQSAARLGEDIVLVGSNLSATDCTVALGSPLSAPVILVPTDTGTPGELGIHIADAAEDPQAPTRWNPGYYTVAVTRTSPDLPPVSSNAQPLALAPAITIAPAAAVAGDIVLTVTCAPQVRKGQRVLLLFGDRQVEPVSVVAPADTGSVTFTVTAVQPGSYVVRLRIDGVDSIPAIYTGTPPLASFDPAQTMVVT